MRSKITVVGAGMVGSVIAQDLAKVHDVVLADINEAQLAETQAKEPRLRTKVINARSRSELEAACTDSDLVVGAVPGFMGFELLENLIEIGKDVVDISFCPEDVLQLDSKARNKGVSIFVDAGVAPGLSNLALGYYDSQLELSSFKCMVGGLPKNPSPPWNYKAPFSPIDVIEEYTRPARFIRDGKEITMDALSEIEEIELKGMKLEAFNSDGLRTILQTMSHVPNMVEKTIRYPGHASDILVLRDAGFFNKDKLDFDGGSTTALELTSALLLDKWKLRADEPEFTIMQMEINGIDRETGKQIERLLLLYDERDSATGFSSMARTTGFTATAVCNYFIENNIEQKGIIPLETLGKIPGAYSYVVKHLADRNVRIE